MPTQQHINMPRLIFWGISYLSLVGSSVISYGNPVEPNVVRGAAEFSNPAAGHLRIDQFTQRAVIDWRSFDIDAGELTEFRMPSSDSVSLNRVSGTGQSIIDGRLTSNGNVFLLNPNGVVIGKNSRIDVGGFVASSLNLDNDQFMAAGNLRFHGDSNAPVINLGQIGASHGDIILIAPQVTNEGSLIAPNGRVGLAAGNDVMLKVDGTERLFVRSATTKGGVLNKGVIEANIAELKSHDGNVYGMAIQNEGRINAKTLTKEGGKIYLRSGRGKISNTGSLKAKGGDIRIDAGPAGEVEVAGTLETTSDIGRGGSITITGGEIDLAAGALVIADGIFGGGEIIIGGGRRGQDPNLQNAINVKVADGATITANATLKGDGGNVILFAEDTLSFGGRISADGGLQRGDGGFIELSGQNEIFINQLIGNISLNASTGGKAGTLLIDPNDISIIPNLMAPIGNPVNDNVIFDTDISDFLELTGNLIVETTGTGGMGNINIDLMAIISWTTGNSLTFNADGNFTNNGFISSVSGPITVNAIGNINLSNGYISSNFSTINLNAGGSGFITSSPAGFISASAISLTAGAGIGTSFNPIFMDTGNISTNSSSQNGDQFLFTGINTGIGTAGLNAGNGTINLLGGDFYHVADEQIANNSSLHVNGASLYFNFNNETLASFTLSNGIVVGGNSNLTISGPFAATGGFSGGFFYAGSSTLNIGGNFTATNGSFFCDTSTVSLNGALTLNATDPLNNLVLNTSGTITLAADAAVYENLTIQNSGGIIGSGGMRNLIVSGNVFNADTNFGMANAFLTLNGITDQTLSGNGILANLNIAKFGGDVILANDFKLGGSGGIGVGGSLTGFGTTIRGASGTEQIVIVDNYAINFGGTIEDLKFNQGNFTTTLVQDLNVTDTLNIQTSGGIIGFGFSGMQSLNVSGDVSNASPNFSMTNALLTLNGFTDQTLSGTGNLANLNISKFGGDVILANDLKLGGGGNGGLTGTGSIRGLNGTEKIIITDNYFIDFGGTIEDLAFNQGNFTTTLFRDLNVTDTLTIQNTGGIIGSGFTGMQSINVSGDVFNADSNFGMANALLTLNGFTDQTLSGTGILANLNIAKSGGDVILANDFNLGGGGGILAGTGTIRGASGTERIIIVDNYAFDFGGNIENLEINQGNFTTTLFQDLNVTDTLSIQTTDGIIGFGGIWNLNVRGDVFNADTNFGMADALLTLNGSTDQILSGTGILANLNVSKFGGDVILANDFNLGGGGGILAGTGTIRGASGTEHIIIVDNYAFDFGGTIENLEINQGNFTTTLFQNLNVTDTLYIHTTGAIIGSGGTRNLYVSGDVSNADTNFGMANALLTLNGSTDQTLSGAGILANLNVSKFGGDVILINDFKLGGGRLTGTGTIRGASGTEQIVIVDNYAFNFGGTIEDLVFNQGNFTTTLLQNLNVTDTLAIQTTGGIIGSGGTRKLNVSGDVFNADSNFGMANALLTLNGATNQTLSGTGILANLNVSKFGGHVILANDFNLGGGSLTGTGTIRGASGTEQIVIVDNYAFNFGGTIEDLEINQSELTTTLLQNLNVTDTLTIQSSGAINGSGGPRILNVLENFVRNDSSVALSDVTILLNGVDVNFNPETVTETVNTLSVIPIPTAPTGGGGGGTPTFPTATVTNNFSSTNGGTSRTTSNLRTSSVQLISQITSPTTPTTPTTPTSAPAPVPPAGGGLFSSANTPAGPATSVTAPPTGSAPTGPASMGGGPPASPVTQTQITQSTNPQSEMELSKSLGLQPGANVNSGEGSLSMELGGVAPNPGTQASLSTSTGDSAFAELAVATGTSPAISFQKTDGSSSMQPNGLPPTSETRQSLSEAINPSAATDLSLALGGDGTAPTSASDGPAPVGLGGAQPRGETTASLQSNISPGSASELSMSLGGSGETSALPGQGTLTLDPDGTPPSAKTTKSLQTSTSAQEESELSQSMGLGKEGIAQSTDGPVSDDFSAKNPSPKTAQSLQDNTSEATSSELRSSLSGAPTDQVNDE